MSVRPGSNRRFVVALGLCLLGASCQSSDPLGTAAGPPPEASARTSLAPVAASDLSEWYAEVDGAIDRFQEDAAELQAADDDRLADGERDFVVGGEQFGAWADIGQRAIDALPEPLGEPTIDPLYADLQSSLEELVAAHEAGAVIYAADPDGFRQQWQSAADPDGIFERRDQSHLGFQDSCLELSEAGALADEAALDCLGSEAAARTEAVADADRPGFQVLEVGDSVDLTIGEVELTYRATVTSERADWGEDWLAVNDQPDFGHQWWLGVPDGLADPDGELALDAVVDSVPFTLDLDPWLADLDIVEVLDTGTGDIGGLPARFWDVRLDLGALGPGEPPVIALVDADNGAPVGGLQLAFEMAWRMWTVDHPSGPLLYLQTAFLPSDEVEAIFSDMTPEQMEAGEWPDIDRQVFVDAIATLDGYADGLTFPLD